MEATIEGMENCLSAASRDMAEAQLAAKRAARAEAREIRMKELERQQKEVEERPDKDFNDKGARTASSLSAATLASLGGTSSRRGSGDTSISVDTEASIREIKDSLAEVEEKYKKAMVSNAQLDNEKTNFMYQVDTLKDVLLELEEQLAETHRQYEEKSKEFEREKHGHRILQVQYNELKESLQQRDELLTRHGIVLCSDLSPNGGILDGPLHEALLESSTKVMDNAAPVSKTGDGPLGSASEVKLKSDTAVEGQSVLSSKTTEDAGVQTEETSLLSERQEEAKCSGGSSAEQPCMSADGHIESFITAGEQVAKKTDLHNVDSIPSSGIGLDASIVRNPVVNSSSEASEGHVKETNTLQTQRDVETKSRIENQRGEVEFERAKCSEKESLGDDFQDAVDFSNVPNISGEKELHNHDKRIVATNEEPQERPVLESPKVGFNIKGILQNLGRHLDKVFDKVDGPVDSPSESSKESTPPNIHLELEVSGVSAQALEGDKDSFMPSVGTVECSKEAAGAKGGEDIASVEPLENSVVNTEVTSSCGDGSFVVNGTIQGQPERGIPFGGKRIEPDTALSGVCVALANHEVKGHVKEVDVEGKAHSDEGEFYECSSEGSSPTGAVLEPKLEEPLNDTQHQEASNTGFSVSSPQTLEKMDTNTKEQVTETFRDNPSQLSHMHNPDLQLCNAKVEDEKNIEEQGLEGGGTVTSQGHDTQEAGINKITSQHDLGESSQNGDTREDGDSFQFDEDGENVDPSPTVAQEFAKGSAEIEHINGSTPTSVTEIPVQAVPKLQNKSVLTEANNDAHQEGLSPEATEKETEVSSLPPSQETSNIEIKHDLEQSTPSQGMENTFVDPSEPLGLSESPGYSKEDTLDRNIKRGKSKNKEDCLLS